MGRCYTLPVGDQTIAKSASARTAGRVSRLSPIRRQPRLIDGRAALEAIEDRGDDQGVGRSSGCAPDRYDDTSTGSPPAASTKPGSTRLTFVLPGPAVVAIDT